jgi:hypothetical protein
MKKRVFKRVIAVFVGTLITMQLCADSTCTKSENGMQEQQSPGEEPQQSGEDIVVLPSCLHKVDNTDFELFLTAIVDAASQTGKQALLSRALLSCFDYLSDNQKIEYLERIEKELPELIEHVQLYKVGHGALHTR